MSIRWLLKLIGICIHEHMRRELQGGVLHFVCDCGHQVPVIQRTRAEMKAMSKRFKAPVMAKAQRKGPQADVVPMAGRTRRAKA